MTTLLGSLALAVGVCLVLLACALCIGGHRYESAVAVVFVGLGALGVAHRLLWLDEGPGRTRQTLMRMASAFAILASASLILIAFRMLDTIPAWFGPLIGYFVSLALMSVAGAFYITPEKQTYTRYGRLIRQGYNPRWHRLDMALTVCLAVVGLLYFGGQLLTALRAHR